MIFSVIIILIVAGVAYFHYAQGFFGATISAVVAMIAAALAVSYHENVVASLLQGKMADYANAICLVGIFALTYILLRTLTDKAIPGQIRLPVIVDRVGGAAMGIVAAIFTAGIFALAAQSLPFGPSVAGYKRYAIEDSQEVQVFAPGASRAADMTVVEQMKDDTFLPESASSLLIPVDDIVLNFVSKLSDNGSLAGARTLQSVHPNYADELFAQRLGIQIGAQRTAMNLDGKAPQVTVPEPGLFKIDKDLSKDQVDAELNQLHQRAVKWQAKPPDDLQLIVRVVFTKDAADSDQQVRFSPASVRLVINGKNHYPVGTLEDGVLFSNKVDDFLLTNVRDQDCGADFVFFLNPKDAVTGGANPKDLKIRDGTFLEVKRLAKIDLSGRPVVTATPPPSKSVSVVRKPGLLKSKGKDQAAGAQAPADPTAQSAAPFVYKQVVVSKQLFSPINTGTPDKDVKNAQLQSGTISLQSGQFTQLDINTTQSLQVLKQGSYATSELFEPTGMKLIQVVGAPQPEGGDPWGFGTLKSFAVVDAAGKAYPPAGAWAQVKKESDRMVARYSITGTPPDITAEEGRPTDVWVAFLVPSGTHLKQLTYNGKVIGEMDQLVP